LVSYLPISGVAMERHEYAFDVKLAAVARVVAFDEASARNAIARLLDAADVLRVFSDKDARVLITEISAYVDAEDGPVLFEIDGVELDVG
jgi:hypothetical protein